MEAFLAYALFVSLLLVPTAAFFYFFHGDWFLFYWVDTARAPWVFGLFTVLLVAGAALVGFRLGAALCRASRDRAARALAMAALLVGCGVWPLAWGRLSVVGSHRQFTRDYGLTTFFASPACYSGLAMLVIAGASFAWVAFRIGRQTRETG